MVADVVSSMTPLVRIQRLMGLFPVVLHQYSISFSKTSLLTLMSFFLPYAIVIPRIFLIGWNQRILSSKISLSVYVLELVIKGSPMVFLFHPIVELVDYLNISDNLLPSKPKTKNIYLWPILSFAVFVMFYLATCYFSGVSDMTSFLMRFPIALMYHRDYQQLIIFAFFVDQICARYDIVFYLATCYFSGVSDMTSFLMRFPIALMYHRDYQQLIIFAFFVDQICARYDIVFYLATCYFSGVSDMTSFLMRFPIALMYHRDYQQLIIFAFFVDQICARYDIVRTMRTSSDNARLAHAMLCKCVRMLSEGFGLRYFFIVVTVGYDELCNVFQYAYSEDELSNLEATVFYALTDLCMISIFALLSQVIMNKGKTISDDLLALNTTKMDLRSVRQIELFLEEVRTTELNITAWGVFPIDIGIFSSYINTLLTFFIAMAGFSNEIITIIEKYHLNQ